MESKLIPTRTACLQASVTPAHYQKDSHKFKQYNFNLQAAFAGIFLLLGLISFTANAAPSETALQHAEQVKLNNPAHTQQDRRDAFARGRIILKPRAGLPMKAFTKLLQEHDGKAHKIGQSNIFVVEVPEYAEEGIVATLQHHPHLQYAELDYIIEPAFVPNDPQYADQWHLPNISAPEAWNETHGSGVTIAILDSGANSAHTDLAGQILPGWNFYDNNDDTTDLTGHGTWVTGTAAAISNNATGVAGVAGQSKILPIRVTGPIAGSAYYSLLTKGFIYAADHGARVASASFNNVMGDQAARDAAQYMRNKNGLVTVSAGNTNSLTAYIETDTMIAVSATEQNDLRAYFSSYGPYVDIAAPGLDILTTDMNGGYAVVKGTSFSAPMTAAVLALMWSANPDVE